MKDNDPDIKAPDDFEIDPLLSDMDIDDETAKKMAADLIEEKHREN